MDMNKAPTFVLGNTNPTPVETDVIHVVVSEDNLFAGFAQAFVFECMRVAPLKAKIVDLTEEEVTKYINYLLTQRIKQVNRLKIDYVLLKNLAIPSWIQYIIAMIGRVEMRDVGIIVQPEIEKESEMTFDEALTISNRIDSFSDDLQIVKDAFPRTIDGDRDVMSTAMIAGYVKAMKPVQHVASTYAAAFAGMKLREEAAFKVLYRVAYDDLNLIRSAILHTDEIFK